MTAEKIIEAGSKVSIHFRISLDNGFIADDTFAGEPFTFTSGDGSLAEGLDQVLIGLKEKTIKQFTLKPEQAFGMVDQDKVHQLPKSDFPDDIKLAKGQIIGFSSPSGEEVPGTVKCIDEQTVTVDFNHPLAGQTIIFDVEVLSIE